MKIKHSSDLTDYFEDFPKEKKILAVGVGSAGCRILSKVKRTNTSINRYAAISVDEDDLKGVPNDQILLIRSKLRGRILPNHVRAAAASHISEITELIGKPDLTFVISGFGGGVGSALAPIVGALSKETGALTIGVAVMPYKFEKNKHFQAAIGLKRFRLSTDAVIVIDNEGIFQHDPEMPILDTYSLVNEKISLALEKITGCSNEKEFAIGLNKLAYTIDQEGLSILCVHSSGSIRGAEDAVVGAAQTIYRIAEPNRASRAILHLVGDDRLSASDIATSARRLNDLLGGSLEIHHGFSAGRTRQLTAILVASGFKNTKYDDYDPLSARLDERQIDDSPECAIGIEMPNLSSIE